MQIVQADEMPEIVRRSEHREGTWTVRQLAEGTPGDPGNYRLEIVGLDHDMYSPRHRHNFDQYRYQLKGWLDLDRDGRMTPGLFGYFPEGTPYGPQTSDDECSTLVLQFGSASGSGMVGAAQRAPAFAELKKLGTFEKGIFKHVLPNGERKSMDGYQAMWEHINGRPMVYPKQRYAAPIMINPENFEWIPVAGAPGVAEKLAGSFTERCTEARFLKLSAGARYVGKGRIIYFVLHGAGQFAGQSYRKGTTAVVEFEEEATFDASAESEILMFGLPKLS